MKAAIYCRLSREDREKQGESESIRNQKALLTQYALDRGYEIAGVYWDQDYSGMDRDRPGFRALLRDARDHKFDLVLTKTQSRFTRDMALAEEYLQGKFPEWGVRFLAVVDGVDTQDGAGKKSRQINGLVNQWYLEDLSASVRAVLDQKRRQGVYIASFPLYGYRKDPTRKGRLIPDPATAPVVEGIFALALAGAGARKIARTLNQEAVPCPAAYKALSGISCPGAGEQPLWSAATVSRILHNRTYAGDLVQGRHRKASYRSKKTLSLPPDQWTVVPGTHQPLIPPQTFDRVQELLRSRARSGAAGKIHPLARLAVCGGCGSILEQTGTGGRRYLRCRIHQRAPDRCSNSSCTPLEPLEALVLDRIRGYAAAWFELEALSLPPVRDTLTGKRLALERERQGLDRELDRRQKALEALWLDRGEGVLDRETFLELSGTFRREKEELTRRRSALEADLARLPDPAALEADRRARASALARAPALTRALAAGLVEKIIVSPRDPDTGIQQRRLGWKF